MLVLSLLFPVSRVFDTVFITKCDHDAQPDRLTHPLAHWSLPLLLCAFHQYQLHFGLLHPAFQLWFIYYCFRLWFKAFVMWFKAFVMSRDKNWWRHCFFSSSTPPLLSLGGPCTPGWEYRVCHFRHKRFKRGGRQLILETTYPIHPPDDVSFIASLGIYVNSDGHIVLGVIPTLLGYLYSIYSVTHLWITARIHPSSDEQGTIRAFQQCIGLLLPIFGWLFTVPDALLLWCITVWFL